MLTERMKTVSRDWGQYSREDLRGLEGSSMKNFKKNLKIEKTIKWRVNYMSRINEKYSHSSHICEWGSRYPKYLVRQSENVNYSLILNAT